MLDLMKKLKSRRYITGRARNVLLHSDLLATRSMVGISSFVFACLLSLHYAMERHISDLWWVLFSLFHSLVAFWSLFCNKISRFTFIGEALFGFILWNYISIMVVTSYDIGEKFYPIDAPFAPTFVVGIATWWILARYPIINSRKIGK